MRRIAIVKDNPKVKRVMLYQTDDGFYLFSYDRIEDCSSVADYLYDTIEEVYEYCQDEYNVQINDWQDIVDPYEYCQHDWISPVRIKGRENGKPEWGKFEKLIDGEWIEMKQIKKKSYMPNTR